jgi:hypothetical protein
LEGDLKVLEKREIVGERERERGVEGRIEESREF